MIPDQRAPGDLFEEAAAEKTRLTHDPARNAVQVRSLRISRLNSFGARSTDGTNAF